MAYDMRPETAQRIRDHLATHYGMARPSPDNAYLRGGKCPCCGRKTLWSSYSAPWVVRCERANHCGWEARTKDLIPDLYSDLSRRAPPTPDNPTATADRYMSEVRGLPPAVTRGMYRQGRYSHPQGDGPTATVVFDLPAGAEMLRLIDPVTITADGERETRKAIFRGAHRGQMWTPPGQIITPGEQLWLTEGIIDALTVMAHGHKAAAILSCGNYPSEGLAAVPRGTVLVWALDADKAGITAMRRHVERARQDGWTCFAALPPQRGRAAKTDWNDLHCLGVLDDDCLDQALHLGALALARSARAKARLLWDRSPRKSFVFEYDGETWACDVGQSKDDDSDNFDRRADVRKILNALIEFDFFLSDRLVDETSYQVTITTRRNTINTTLTGAQLSAPAQIKARILSVAPGVVWTGTAHHLDTLIQEWIPGVGLPTVQAIDHLGYVPDYGAYIWSDIAVADGKIIRPQAAGHYVLPDGTAIRSTMRGVRLVAGTQADYHRPWLSDIWDAFGPQGIVIAALFCGSIYSNQLRQRWQSYPFLEINGRPGTGKSTLLSILWRVAGRDAYEGVDIDPGKTTRAARLRTFRQLSGLPTVVLEGDRDHGSSPVDWDALKSLYNGGSPGSRGVKNAGVDTDDAPYQGALIIAQNEPVNASPATMSRIVQVSTSDIVQTPDSQRAVDRLLGLDARQLSWHTIAMCMQATSNITALDDRIAWHRDRLTGIVRTQRVRINYAQAHALVEMMARMAGLPDHAVARTAAWIDQAAIAREALCGDDRQEVAQFWEIIRDIRDLVDHGKHTSHVAINWTHLQSVLAQQRIVLPLDIKTIRKLVCDGKAVRCTSTGKVNSRLLNRTAHCSVFSAPVDW